MSEGQVYRRKPWQAGVLSLFVPGLGHGYNGQARKGVLLFCLYALGFLAGLRMMLEFSFAPWNIAFPVGGLLAGNLVILVDAVTMARRQRDPVPRKFYHTASFAILWLLAFMVMAYRVPYHPDELGTGIQNTLRWHGKDAADR